MKRFYWKGISTDDRRKAIGEITLIVDKYGLIANFQRFSDVVFSLLIEIEERKLNGLFDELKTIISIEGHEGNLTEATNDCFIFLNITFTKSTGDLEIEVPNFPE
jgi:hypothetical protein